MLKIIICFEYYAVNIRNDKKQQRIALSVAAEGKRTLAQVASGVVGNLLHQGGENMGKPNELTVRRHGMHLGADRGHRDATGETTNDTE